MKSLFLTLSVLSCFNCNAMCCKIIEKKAYPIIKYKINDVKKHIRFLCEQREKIHQFFFDINVGKPFIFLNPYLFDKLDTFFSIVLNNSITGIADRTFYNKKLTSISFENANKLVTIGHFAFYGCKYLKNVTFNKNVKLTTMGRHMFDNSGIENIDMCNNFLSEGMFANCENLKEIHSIESNTILPSYVFYNCKNLSNIKLSNNLTLISESAFEGCKSLDKFDFRKSIIVINNRAFYGCSSIKEVSIHDGVQRLGNEAFGACTSLKKVTLNNYITLLGDNIFDGCCNLENILSINNKFHTYILRYNEKKDGKWLKNIIFDGDFYGFCTDDEKDSPFPNYEVLCGYYGTSGLTYAQLDTKKFHTLVTSYDNKTFILNYELRELPSNAFFKFDCMHKLIIGDNIKKIRSNACIDCQNLTEVVIGKNVEVIQHPCFVNCEKLKTVTFRMRYWENFSERLTYLMPIMRQNYPNLDLKIFIEDDV